MCKPFQREHKHIFTFHVIPPHWYDTGSRNHSSSKTRTYLFCTVNSMAADVLVTQGARASATMILTMFNRDNSVPACQGLISHFTAYHTYIKTCHMEDKIDDEHLFNYTWMNTPVTWWCYMATKIWVNIGSGNGLLPDGTKPLPEPVLTCHLWDPFAFSWGQFRSNCSRYHSLQRFRELLEMEHSGFGGQYHACWCPGSQCQQSITRHGIGCVGQTTCIVVPELISPTWVKPNPRYD